MMRVKPWMVALALAIVGIAGAVVVSIAARSQHRADRAAVERWNDTHGPLVTRLLGDIDVVKATLARLGTARSATARDAATMRSLRGTADVLHATVLRANVPDFMTRVLAEESAAADAAVTAVSLVEQAVAARALPLPDEIRQRATRLLTSAESHGRAAQDALHRLACRTRAASCVRR